MRIHLLAEASPNPVLTAVMAELARRHEVAVYDARTLPSAYGREPGQQEPPDVVLLKSRTPEARRVARTAERAGSLVVNPPAATTAALDRAATADALERAGVPAPRSWSVPALRELALRDLAADHAAHTAALPWPLVVKSRTSSRRDLVRLVSSRTELAELLPEWGDEPVVAQEFAANDGFDIKVWVIGTDLSAARRRSALESTDKSSDELLDPDDLPEHGSGRRATPEPPWACSSTASTCSSPAAGRWWWTSIPSRGSAAPRSRRTPCSASSRRSRPRGR